MVVYLCVSSEARPVWLSGEPCWNNPGSIRITVKSTPRPKGSVVSCAKAIDEAAQAAMKRRCRNMTSGSVGGKSAQDQARARFTVVHRFTNEPQNLVERFSKEGKTGPPLPHARQVRRYRPPDQLRERGRASGGNRGVDGIGQNAVGGPAGPL